MVTGIIVQSSIAENESNILSVSVKTDKGYYAPGDVIRVHGMVRTSDNEPVNASLFFTFQGMDKKIFSGAGSYQTIIPISLAEPENMYKLQIMASAQGYRDRNLTIPIIIMEEPSSLAPIR